MPTILDHLPRRRVQRRGWRPDTPDMRDHLFDAKPSKKLPAKFSLRDTMPAVYDQGNLGSCTANAIAALVEHAELKPTTPSRLFIYYGERVIEGTVDQDAGAEIRDGIKVVAKVGAPPETLWPYVPRLYAQRPNAAAYRDAALEQAIEYQRVRRDGLKHAIHEGFPVVCGATLYASFDTGMTAATGDIPMPAPDEAIDGGHAFDVIGWDNRHEFTTTDAPGEAYECRNSWSPAWGDQGHFWLPVDYLDEPGLASDFWIIRRMES